jgi:trigger factor
MAEAFNIKETENKGLKRAYEVTVSADYLENKISAQLEKIGKQVKIPGFRPGKVPMAVLKKKYRQNTLGEVLQHSVDDAVRATMKKHDIVPALQPDVKIENYKEDEDLKLSINLEIMPESPEMDFSKVSIETPKIAISDEEVEKSLKRLSESKRTMKDRAKTAKAKKGDVVVIDFKGFLGDEAFAGGEGKDFNLELGSGQFIPGFEDQLIGAKAGDEVEVKVTFPTEYHSEALKGKEARFETKVHKVQEIVTAELDDELAKHFGENSLEALRLSIREMLQKEHEKMARSYVKKALFDALEEKCAFDVPQGMLDLEFKAIWGQALQEAKQRGETEADVEDQREEFKHIAKRRVQLGILLSQTAGRNKLEVTQQDVQSAIIEQARLYPGQEQQVINFFQKNPQQVQELRGPILEEKAVDFILAKVKQKESAKTIQQFVEEEAQAELAAQKKPTKKTPAKKADSDSSAEAKPAAKKTATKADASDKKAASTKTAAKKTTTKKDAS